MVGKWMKKKKKSPTLRVTSIEMRWSEWLKYNILSLCCGNHHVNLFLAHKVTTEYFIECNDRQERRIAQRLKRCGLHHQRLFRIIDT